MPDLQSYIGIPFRARGRDRSGIDCYGLVRLYLREQHGIELDEYEYDVDDRPACGKVVGQAARSTPWTTVEEPRPGDVAILRVMGQPMHCAVCIGGGRILHASDRVGTCIERLASPAWARRVIGYRRHRELFHG